MRSIACSPHRVAAAVAVAAALSTVATEGILTARYTSPEQTEEITAGVSSKHGPRPGALADPALSAMYVIPTAYLVGAQ